MALDTTTKHGILVGVDGSAESDAAVVWATHEAVLRVMPITLMHVVAPVVVGWPVGQLYDAMPQWQEDEAKQAVDRARTTLVASLGESDAPEVRVETIYANVVPTLIDASKQASMIVVGSQGMGALCRILMGSLTTALIHHAHCPVAVIRSDADRVVEPNAPVLVGIDGSPASDAATALAFDEASQRGVELVALHAWSDVGVFPILGMDWRDREKQGEEVLAERLAGWQERYPDVGVQQSLVCDRPTHWLLEASERAQLIVVGSRGRGGFPGMLLGSVSSAVAHSAKVPVILVRA